MQQSGKHQCLAVQHMLAHISFEDILELNPSQASISTAKVTG